MDNVNCTTLCYVMIEKKSPASHIERFGSVVNPAKKEFDLNKYMGSMAKLYNFRIRVEGIIELSPAAITKRH